MKEEIFPRRAFLSRGGAAAVLIGAALRPGLSLAQGEKKKAAAEVSPPEDLMREHGVLSRILLIYEEILRRWRRTKNLDSEILSASAGLIHRFIEEYHEKLEEEFLFPQFEKAGKLTDLVKTLWEQHRAGRVMTDLIRKGVASQDQSQWEPIRRNMILFLRMYRPHKAREDTVLFPATHSLFSRKEFYELGDRFEDREKALFGENGFEKIVSEVAGWETRLDIHDLNRFTPKKGKEE